MNTILSYWYRIAAPPEPRADAPLYQREIVRRARIISLVMLLTVFLAALPLAFSPLVEVIPTLAIVLIVDFIAIQFNRTGRITIAGWIIVLTTQVGLAVSMAAAIMRGGLELSTFELICLFVQPIGIAASVLRPRQSLFVLLINLALLPTMIVFAPKSASFTQYLHTSLGANEYLYVIPMTVMIMTYVAMVIWVTSANSAIHRADEADRTIKKIETQSIVAQVESRQKKILERDLTELQNALAAISNNAKIPLQISLDNSLQPLAISLETWRKRSLQNSYEQVQLNKIRQGMAHLNAFLEAGMPLEKWQQTKTPVDDLLYNMLKYRTIRYNPQRTTNPLDNRL